MTRCSALLAETHETRTGRGLPTISPDDGTGNRLASAYIDPSPGEQVDGQSAQQGVERERGAGPGADGRGLVGASNAELIIASEPGTRDAAPSLAQRVR